MKLLLSVILFLCVTSHYSSAQTDSLKDGQPGKNINIRICAPSRHQLVRPPLYVIIFKAKVIYKDTLINNMSSVSLINPSQIKSLNVLKGRSAIERYGDMAKNGVIEVMLDDQKYPKAWKSFSPDSIRIKLQRDSAARLKGDTVRYRRLLNLKKI